jgi:hypothetical protein
MHLTTPIKAVRRFEKKNSPLLLCFHLCFDDAGRSPDPLSAQQGRDISLTKSITREFGPLGICANAMFYDSIKIGTTRVLDCTLSPARFCAGGRSGIGGVVRPHMLGIAAAHISLHIAP